MSIKEIGGTETQTTVQLSMTWMITLFNHIVMFLNQSSKGTFFQQSNILPLNYINVIKLKYLEDKSG